MLAHISNTYFQNIENAHFATAVLKICGSQTGPKSSIRDIDIN